MEREIKFKIWIPYINIMMQPKDIQTIHESILNGVTIGQMKQWVYLQYTGLKDKNGKEIYEGDIVKCSSSFGCPHEVVWAQVPNGNLGCYYCWYLSGLSEGYSFTGQEEIIGNIYEHPTELDKPIPDQK